CGTPGAAILCPVARALPTGAIRTGPLALAGARRAVTTIGAAAIAALVAAASAFVRGLIGALALRARGVSDGARAVRAGAAGSVLRPGAARARASGVTAVCGASARRRGSLGSPLVIPTVVAVSAVAL